MIHQLNPHSSDMIRQMLDQAAESANGATPTTGSTSSSAPPTYLTPDAIMAYCQSRLQSIDGQVETAMTQQQNCNNEQTGVQGILTDVSSLQSELNNGVVKDHGAAAKLEGDLEKLISQMQATDPSNPQIGTLEQLHDTIMATGTGPNNGAGGYYCSANPPGSPTGQAPPPNVNQDHDDTFGTDELTSFSQTLTGVNNALNNSAELGMIQIQSLMSQRTTAIQLSTNILQSMDDGMSKIVDNVGH